MDKRMDKIYVVTIEVPLLSLRDDLISGPGCSYWIVLQYHS